LEQQYTDARVAAALCVGGPIKYKLKEDSGVTDEFLAEHVVPGIASFFGADSSVTKVLGKALLWSCLQDLDDEQRKQKGLFLNGAIVERVKQEYAAIRRLPEGVNPVEKVRQLVRDCHCGQLSSHTRPGSSPCLCS
jgi:hypothetical protein